MINDDLNEYSTEIAIIGMAGRFPGANNVKQYWKNIVDGIETIKHLPKQANDSENVVRASGFLDNIDLFDADFFGFSPREAEIMDPQQRLLLECAVEALEDAGYSGDIFQGKISVFIGSAISTYLLFNLLARKDLLNSVGLIQLSNGNDSISTSISYKLNLTGPSIDLNTTCSTSLVAVHSACRSLLNFESDIALAGGASINVLQSDGYIYNEGGIHSPDGHCRPFDADAKGTVEGSGLGIVILRRLEDAVAEGDHIYAIIKGSAINNDGAEKVGYTAPSVEGQAKVIAEAIEIANVEAESIGYIEAHGTGTVLGDPIEMAALIRVFQNRTKQENFCGIGSVKSNIGHLNTASGIAGLIKTVLALKNRKIPPSLNFKNLNPQINLQGTPFYINSTLKDWDNNKIRRAGVSSFGIGGTNAHVILEEYINSRTLPSHKQEHLLLLSTKSPEALQEATFNLIEYLQNNLDINIADVAYTLQMGRKNHSYRKYIVVNSIEDAIHKLQEEINQLPYKQLINHRNSVVFMFPGQGAQYINMALDIYKQNRVFRESIDNCCNILLPLLNLDLRTIIYPDDLSNQESLNTLLNRTDITQISLFIVEYSLAKLLMYLGINPDGMIGHSLGEYVAACISGVFSLEDALNIVVTRGRLMQHMQPGKMISVNLSEDELAFYLDNNYDIAAINSEKQIVISGTITSIDSLIDKLNENKIQVRTLHTSHAFHSILMEPMLDSFSKCLQEITLNPPMIPYISNLSGTWITQEEATSIEYWSKHLRNTVQFKKGIEFLTINNPNVILLEIGPGQTLTDLLKYSKQFSNVQVVQTMPHFKHATPSTRVLMNAIGRLWLKGSELQSDKLYRDEKRHRLSIPTYPFQRKRFWIERFQENQKTDSKIIIKNDINNWCYAPSWQRESPIFDITEVSADEYWLAFNIDILKSDLKIYQIKSGVSFHKISPLNYEINFDSKSDFQRIFKEIIKDKYKKINIVYSAINQSNVDQGKFNIRLKYYFFRLFYLLQALVHANITNQISIAIITEQAHKVIGNEYVEPEKQIFIGLIKALRQEYPHINWSHIDIIDNNNTVIDSIISEFFHGLKNNIIAYRGSYRWIQTYKQVNINLNNTAILKQGGTYLITGGLGQIGLIIAKKLADDYNANIILLSRSRFPEEDQWQNETTNVIRKKINKLYEIKKTAKSIHIIQGDISQFEVLDSITETTEKNNMELNGIIHAAGLITDSSFKMINQLTEDDFENHFKAKIYGLNSIVRLLEKRTIDFCCLFSSISSVFSGLGYAAYSVANLYLDAYSLAKQGDYLNTRFISISWDAWQHGEEDINQLTSFQKELSKYAITPEEGSKLFVDLVNSQNSQIIISTTDIDVRINKWIQLENKPQHKKSSCITRQAHTRPNLENNYAPARDSLEQDIVNIWEDLFGIQQIGINDNFFELGGHSLMATQLASRIREKFSIEFTIQLLFDNPTIAGIANILFQKKLEDLTDKDIEELLLELPESTGQ